MVELTQAKVRELFDYRDDGELIWKRDCGWNKTTGLVAGSITPRGYKQVSIKKKLYQVHRLVYLWHHGVLPKYVDHRDRSRANNRISNLREVSGSQNNINSSTRANTTGYKGVRFHRQTNSYQARIMKDYKYISLGYHKTPQAAHEVYKAKREQLYPGVYEEEQLEFNFIPHSQR
jgi:hypothetical protein